MQPPRDFQLGCTYNFIQAHEKITPLERFQLVKNAKVFDYINWLPPHDLIRQCIAASEKTDLPMTTGNCVHTYGSDNSRFFKLLEDAGTVRMSMLNVMLSANTEDKREISDEQILELYGRGAEIGARFGVDVSFELHVDCWSEKYKRITPIIEAAKQRGYNFNFTLDYSHVIFKIDNLEQQEISDVREDVEKGRIILDPFEKGNLCAEWLSWNVISFAQFRPVAPNNPRNIWGKNPDGSMPRGILYPMVKPKPGEWHSPWSAHRLAACKEAFRTVLRYHLSNEKSPLRFVITEMIPSADYAMNTKFSLIDQNVACAQWIRTEWARLKAIAAAEIALQP